MSGVNQCAGPSKKRRDSQYSKRWENISEYSAWIKKRDEYTALCKYCQVDISVSKIAANISCGRTKAAAIARNVLAPYAQEKIVADIQNSYYFSIGNDAASIGNQKFYVYTVQSFNPNVGIRKRLLDFYEGLNGSSKDIFGNIKRITEYNNLHLRQVSSFSVDNAAVNYGVHNSVFQKLLELNNNVLKANCNCHVINNCLKHALNSLSVDMENIRHVPTRWLSLSPALERLIYNWPAVKRYFLLKGEQNTRKELWDFVTSGQVMDDISQENEECFEESISEAYLFFVHNVIQAFQTAVLMLMNAL